CGRLARQRVPRCERPRRRAILVEAPVSSMKTSRAGSRSGCAARQACLARATSARSCSLACAVFFERLGVAIQTSPDRARRKALAVRPFQVLGDLRQRDVDLGGYQPQDLLGVSLDPRRALVTTLRARCATPRLAPQPRPLYHRRGRQPEPIGYSATAHASANSFHGTPAKIVG